MTSVYLKKKISRRVEDGHPWIFANEVNTITGAVDGGDIVDVFTHDKKFIGRGYINPKSQIMVRLLTRDRQEMVNDDFFYNRLLKAYEYIAKYNLGYDVPFTTYTNCIGVIQTVESPDARGNVRPVWEVVYNHYVKRKG